MKYKSISFIKGHDLDWVFWGLNVFLHQIALLAIVLKVIATSAENLKILKSYQCKAIIKNECFCIANLFFPYPFTKNI